MSLTSCVWEIIRAAGPLLGVFEMVNMVAEVLDQSGSIASQDYEVHLGKHISHYVYSCWELICCV